MATPINSRQISRILDGKPTELLLQNFADRVFILVTQMGKVGNLIQATIPPTTPLLPAMAPDPSRPNHHPLPPPPAAIELTPLLGNPPSEHLRTLHALYAAQIATIIWTEESNVALAHSRRGIIVGLALLPQHGNDNHEESEKDIFQGVIQMLQELLVQS